MKTVNIYYAGIPSKNKNREKELVLDHFHKGVTDGQSEQIRTAKWTPSDLAVLQGWVHVNSGSTPHLMFRKEVIQNQKKIGKHTLAIDSNLFLYRDPNNTKSYLRFSLDGVFPTTGNYFADNVDPARWKQISADLNLSLKDWRLTGNHILICLQRNGGWSMGDLDVMKWCNITIKRIRNHSDRPIVVRAHPGDKKAKQYLKLKHSNVRISTNENILSDLTNAWACVTYNSSPGVASAIEGVPVFVTDPNPKISQAYDVANTDLKNIETPDTFERQTWIEKLCMCHYNFDELSNGTAWNIIKEYV